jgi:WD40 repeat protein
LKEIEEVAPSKDHYSNLCLLLTINKLAEHPDYRSWNPSKGRHSCFKEILPLVEDLLSGDKRQPVNNGGGGGASADDESAEMVASNDRLLQLIIKGILYESCVDYCQQKATGAKHSEHIKFTNLLSQSDFSDSDLSLLSWLQSIPSETFACPFEQRSLNVDVERLKNPMLETSWTEHMLITPIKPNIFPHSAMPSTRPKGTDIMTKSLNMSLHLGASALGLSGPRGTTTENGGPALIDMSKSLASFHLSSAGGQGAVGAQGHSRNKAMDTSVDHLFKEGESVATVEGSSTGAPDLQHDKQKTQMVSEYHRQKSGTIVEEEASISKSQDNEFQELTKQSVVSTVSTSTAPRFMPVCSLEDVQAIRCAEFHPSGKLFAVGSNSKTLRLCAYPEKLVHPQTPQPPIVLAKRTKHHKGSIYCMAWSPKGDLIATGSNDKTVKILKYDAIIGSLESNESEITVHDGTIRDCAFLEDTTTGATLLASGGAGDCRIHLTDCNTMSIVQSLSGHSGHVLSLYSWGGAVFVSGGADKTIRFWDIRARGCVNMVQYGGNNGSAVASCAVDPSGRLLVSGHEDASCILYDVRGGRTIQSFKTHSADVRSVRFSPNAFYLLTGGYDNRIVLTDLQGDLTAQLPSVVVAQHQDKVISGRWHPTDFSFLTTSADKTASLWALPPL